MITVVKMRPFNDTINGDEGKKWFICWLKENNFTDITDTDTISKFCHYDLEATLNSVKYCFELKNRTFPSYKYGDVLLSGEKYDYLNNIREYNEKEQSNIYKNKLKQEIDYKKKLELANKALEIKRRREQYDR